MLRVTKARLAEWGNIRGLDAADELDESRRAIPALISEIERLDALLESIEWAQRTTKLKNGGTIYTAITCPKCGSEKPVHQGDCSIFAALTR